MANNNRKMEEYIENNLRRSSLIHPSDGFTNKLMEKVTSESRSAVVEIKRGEDCQVYYQHIYFADTRSYGDHRIPDRRRGEFEN